MCAKIHLIVCRITEWRVRESLCLPRLVWQEDNTVLPSVTLLRF